MTLRLLLICLVACGGDDTTTTDDTGAEATDDTADTTGPTDDTETDTEPTGVDGDGDGHGDDVDCDDDDDQVFPGADELCNRADDDCDGSIDEEPTDADTWWPDDDGDGYGRTDEGVEACEAPHGYADHDGDCDDTDGRYHPGAPEDDCTVAHDYNCDGSTAYDDADGDLFPACEDCDDSDAFSFPDSPENCDGSDNDCDGDVDEDAIDATTWYGDADGDGAGGTTFTTDACDPPEGYTESADDCDDLDASAFPGGTEVCDDADNDCNGDVDDGVGTTFYADDDGDGYGDPDDWEDSCSEPYGYTSNDDDCDDADPASHPGGLEVCDGADNDCDGDTDDDALDADAWYGDSDGDGYGDPGVETEACDAPTDTVADDTDCDDGDGAVNPGAVEVCNGSDDDCDGRTDDDDTDLDTTTATRFYVDDDGDGHGGTDTTLACEQPSGTAADSYDCDDADASVNLDATEVCNGIDDDCDTYVDDDDPSDLDTSTASSWYADADADGYGDVDGVTLACDEPSGSVSNADDCDDTTDAVSPDADELCSDETDNDCDGDIDEDTAADALTWYADGDGDGYGDDGFTTTACEEPSGHVAEGGDCDDSDTSFNPGATEACDGTDRNCDGAIDGDDDGDGSADSCPDGADCGDHDECDSGYCGPGSATCTTLSEIVFSALDDDYTGNLGGISGADGLCATDAAAYGYSGTWVAWLSDSSHDLRDLIPDTTMSNGSSPRDVWPLVDIHGSQVLADWNTMLGGSSGSSILYAFDGDILEEEYGYTNDADGWHGSQTNGTYYSGQTCSDWSSNSGVGVGMELDASQFLGAETNKDCGTEYAVLCLKVED